MNAAQTNPGVNVTPAVGSLPSTDGGAPSTASSTSVASAALVGPAATIASIPRSGPTVADARSSTEGKQQRPQQHAATDVAKKLEPNLPNPASGVAGPTGPADLGKASAAASSAPGLPSSDFCGVPVDSEYKSKVFRPWTLQNPHHLTFHLVWAAFLTCQFATFSAAALSPIMRQDLDATVTIMNGAGIAAVSGSMISRIVMGKLCDTMGPRKALSAFMLFICPAVFCMSLVSNGVGLIIVRFIIGLSLGCFVTTQFCSTSMFNARIVGLSNATAAAWGNVGGGLAQLFMPLIFLGINSKISAFQAWRWAFFIPAGMMLIMALLFLCYAVDGPQGNFRELRAAGIMTDNKCKPSAKVALLNYRTWMLATLYAFSFGVELTVNNIIVNYVTSQFNTDLITAGGVGSIFGLMNIWSRSCGGVASDKLAAVFGMRGRLWLMFVTQAVAGLFCIGLGLLYDSFAGSVACLCLFAIFAQMSEGVIFSVTPFVSKRSMGAVSGVVGAGGSLGSVILQFAFFFTGTMQIYDGILYMGIIMTAAAIICVPTIYFPMWGSMLQGPAEGADEVLYYLSEFTEDEVTMGFAAASMRFAQESKSQRGSRRGTKLPTRFGGSNLAGSNSGSSIINSLFGSGAGSKGGISMKRGAMGASPLGASTGGIPAENSSQQKPSVSVATNPAAGTAVQPASPVQAVQLADVKP